MLHARVDPIFKFTYPVVTFPIKRQCYFCFIGICGQYFFKASQQGGPIHHSKSSTAGTGLPSFSNAYCIDRVIPGCGSVKVPSRSKSIFSIFINIRNLFCSSNRDIIHLNTTGFSRNFNLPHHERNFNFFAKKTRNLKGNNLFCLFAS